MSQRFEKAAGISRASYEHYPWRGRLRTAPGRAAVLALWIAAGAAIVAGLAIESLPLVVGGLVVWIPAMGAVNVVGGGVNAIRRSELDERELRQRERAWALSHRFMSTVLVVTWAVASAIEGPGPWVAILAGVALVHMAAPSLLLAVQARLPELS